MSGVLRLPFPVKFAGRNNPFPMSRILFFVLVAFVIYLALKGMARKERLRDEASKRRAASPGGEDMVMCSRCGVNVPRAESKVEAGRLVCADNPRCRPAP
jgi:uncharacterized protein